MHERRIVARVQDVAVVAGLKAGAAACRARFTQLNGAPLNGADDADLVVLEAASDIVATVAELEAAKTTFACARFIIIARAQMGPDDVRRLFRSGAADVLSPPITQDQLLSAMNEIIGTAANGGGGGPVIALVKAAGGVGATTIAANLAGFLAAPSSKRGERIEPRRVALLDFDLQFGALALAMDLQPRAGVTEILKNPKRLDAHFLDGVLERHRGGVRVLPAPQQIVPFDAMDPAVALSIVETAAQSFELTLIDLPLAWTDWTSAILRRADHLLLVATASVRGAAGARRVLDAAASVDVEAERWSLVFNRTHGVLEGRDIIDQARTALKIHVLGAVAEDAAAREASDRGRLVWESAPSSRFAKDVRALALEVDRLCERAGQQTERIRRPR